MTDRNATASDTRAPYMIRVSTSRLNSSVPNRCARDGARFLSRTMSGCAEGSYGATSGAATATPASAASTTTPIMAERSRARVRRAARHGDADGWSAPSGTTVGSSEIAAIAGAELMDPHTRVDRRVHHVGHDATDHDQHGADQRRPDDNLVVPRRERAGRDPAHPLPREYLLDEDRPAKECGQGEPGEHDRGDERVPEGVAIDHPSLRHAFRARGADEVLRQDVEQCRALVPRDRGRTEQRESGCREREVLQTIHDLAEWRERIVHDHVDRAAAREHREPAGEEQQQHDTEK